MKRIQEEINEVARRERELRNKLNLSNEDQTNILDNVSGMSDDSGISSSSSPINGISANDKESAIVINSNPIKYNRSQTLNPTTTMSSSQQLLPIMKLTRTMSTPQIFMPASKRFNVSSGQKGMMQRFIASRGKFSPANNRSKDSILVGILSKFPFANKLIVVFCSFQTSIELNRPPIYMSPEASPPIIERDDDGKPLRRGYVPVEEKIQKELRDIKSRECELKKLRRMSKLRQSQPDLLEDINDSVE